MASADPSLFETCQTFFTGLLGFAGVIIAMLVNANIQRGIQASQIKHDIRSLRVALKSELIANRSAYELRIRQFNEPSEFNTALVPNEPVDQVYKSLINKVGQLSEEEVKHITTAYLLLAELPFRLRVLAGENCVVGYKNESIKLSSNDRSKASDIHKSLLPEIVKAIESIERKLSS